MNTLKLTIPILVTWIIIWSSQGVCAQSETTANSDWYQQGGPDRNYVLPAHPLDCSKLNGKPNVVYGINSGFGMAPPIVVDGRLYTYGLYPSGTSRKSIESPDSFISCSDAFSNPRKLPELDDSQIDDSPPYTVHMGGVRGEAWASCWDAITGHLIWATRLTDQSLAYRENNIVSEEASPLLYKDRLYFHEMTGHLFCLDPKAGTILWDRNLYEAHMYQWAQKQGNACGPVAVNDTVVVSFTGADNLNYSKWSGCVLAAAGFDTNSGATKWTTFVPGCALRANNARLGLAEIDGAQQILAPCARSTAALDPATGKILWSFDMPEHDVPFPWTSYAPVAWKNEITGENYVFDAVDAAHDDAPSSSRVMRIKNGKADLVWQTHDFKPYSMIQKSNVVASNGRIYGFDARGYGNEDGTRGKTSLPPGRGMRPADEKRFQCRDFLSGKLIWSSDDFGPKDVYRPTYQLLVGNILIVTHLTGVYVGRLNDNGIEPIAYAPLKDAGDMAEPVLVGSHLYIRQQDLSSGIVPDYAGKANLFMVDLTK